MFGRGMHGHGRNCGEHFGGHHNHHWAMFFDKARAWQERKWSWDNQDEKLDSNSFSYLILYIINEKPSYGYEIIKSIENMFEKTYAPEPEDIYPNLSKLEDMGFLKSDVEQGKKIYSITEEGKAYLESNKEKTDKIFETINMIKNSVNGDDIKKVFSYVRNIGSTVISGYKEKSWGREQIKKLLEILERTSNEIKEI